MAPMKYAIAAAALMLGAASQPVMAGGTCILHPQPFTLKSETVRWSFKIRAGAECIQGLRWSTIMIDIIEPPKFKGPPSAIFPVRTRKEAIRSRSRSREPRSVSAEHR